jgi:hypothetical protein
LTFVAPEQVTEPQLGEFEVHEGGHAGRVGPTDRRLLAAAGRGVEVRGH